MTGHQVLAEDLQPGQRIHVEPHQVHGQQAGLLPDKSRAGTAASDVEIDDVAVIGPHQCDVSVRCHPCYLGGSGQEWVTTYHVTDRVLVIGQAAAA